VHRVPVQALLEVLAHTVVHDENASGPALEELEGAHKRFVGLRIGARQVAEGGWRGTPQVSGLLRQVDCLVDGPALNLLD
jgi:hypothetical protein